MTRNSGKPGNLLDTLYQGFLRWLGRLPAISGLPQAKPDPVVTPAPKPAQPVETKVLLLVFDPFMDALRSRKLSQTMPWHPVDDLLSGFMADIAETSHGLGKFKIIEKIEVDEFPVKIDGFRYDPVSYLKVLQGGEPHVPAMADYQVILSRYDILQKVENRLVDEVWLMAFPHAGFYESRMTGRGAFWCNAPALESSAAASRRFILMGFSYERGVGEMLEAFGHRCESLLIKLHEKCAPADNLYQRFARVDVNFPGHAEVGTVHFAPNSQSDYDWANPRLVSSRCDDWRRFPDLNGNTRLVNADEWGGGDIRMHHRWWLNHLPRAAGQTAGIDNNWWQYLMDPNRVGI